MSHSSDGSRRAIFYALAANGAIAVAKFVASIFTGSNAMMAEAIHSLADCTNQVFLLIGIREARRAPDAAHPMGYGRAVYFWAMMVALLLFFMGGAYSVMEGIEHLKHPQPLSSALVALVVLGVSVVMEGFSLYGAMKEIKKVSGGKPFMRWFRETRQSELLVVAGEDIAALMGLAVAFVAVGLTVVTGNPLWDAMGSIAVGVILIVVAVFIMREVKGMITGESAAPEVEAGIRAEIMNGPEVETILNLITLQWGDQVMVAVQAKMRPQPSDTALVAAINDVEDRIQQKFPQAVWCFFEPDTEVAQVG